MPSFLLILAPLPSEIMSTTTLWDVALPSDPARGNVLTTRAEPLQKGPFKPLTHAKAPYRACQPSLSVETGMPQWPVFGHPIENPGFDAHQHNLACVWTFQHELEVISTQNHMLDACEEIDMENPDSYSPQSSATPDSPAETDILTPQATHQEVVFDNQGLSELFEIQLLHSEDSHSLALSGATLDKHSIFLSAANRGKDLSPASQRLLKSCGRDPVIQSAVLDIFESHEFRTKLPIPWEMADPLLEKIRYVHNGSGKGKRGAPQYYRCLWGSCGEKLSRRLHALEHIMNHVDNRSHLCEHCGKGFVRKNELKKHSPCKALKRKRACLNEQASPVNPDTSPDAANLRAFISTVQPQFQFFPGDTPLFAIPCPQPTCCAVESAIPNAATPSFDVGLSMDAPWLAQMETGYADCFSFAQPVRETTIHCRLMPL